MRQSLWILIIMAIVGCGHVNLSHSGNTEVFVEDTLSEQNIPLDTIIHSDNWIKEIEKFGVQPNKIALLNTSKSLINNPDSAITLLCQIFGTSEVQSFKMNSKGSNVREILEMHDMVYENDEYNIDTVINIGQGLKLYVNSIPRSKHSLTAKISIKCFPESIYYINFVCYIKTADDIPVKELDLFVKRQDKRFTPISYKYLSSVQLNDIKWHERELCVPLRKEGKKRVASINVDTISCPENWEEELDRFYENGSWFRQFNNESTIISNPQTVIDSSKAILTSDTVLNSNIPGWGNLTLLSALKQYYITYYTGIYDRSEAITLPSGIKLYLNKYPDEQINSNRLILELKKFPCNIYYMNLLWKNRYNQKSSGEYDIFVKKEGAKYLPVKIAYIEH